MGARLRRMWSLDREFYQWGKICSSRYSVHHIFSSSFNLSIYSFRMDVCSRCAVFLDMEKPAAAIFQILFAYPLH